VRIALAALVALVSGCTCGSKKSDVAPPPVASAAASASAVAPAPKPNRVVALDAIARLDECTLGHRGVLLDLGDPTMRGRFLGKLDSPELETVEHEGATWAKVTSRTVALSFFWSSELDPSPPSLLDAGVFESNTYVEARVRSVTARSVSVYLNGRVVGAWTLSRGETKVVMARGGSASVAPGPNELVLRFNGGSKKEDDTLAEIDWVHVGNGDAGEPYSAPTRADALVSATVAGVSRRALSLRAPGFVRCSGWLPPSGTVEAQLAIAGAGEADAEVRLLRDRSPPLVLGRAHVSATAAPGAPAPGWTSLSVPLGDVGAAGALGAIEIATVRATKGARVLVAEPRVMGPLLAAPPNAVASAKSAVVIVLGSTPPKALSIYGGPRLVPEIASVAIGGVTFDQHRASTALASGALASMLTGVSPRKHTLEDPDARLPKQLVTIADAARQGGITTAMFTANPLTSSVFGFDRGWDTFAAKSPLADGSSTQVFDDAARWIEDHKDQRFLLVVHARGAHPPWEATLDELKNMPPPNYGGNMDARRAGEIMAKMRKFPGRGNDADRARAWALAAHAIDVHDAAVGRLLGALRNVGREDDTMVVVTGDSGLNESAPIPLSDPDAIDEAALAVPLVVRLPGHALANKRVVAPTTSVDLARTIVGALALAPPAGFEGIDLVALANGDLLVSGERALVATSAARFAVRWGPFVLAGTRERETKLCDLGLEPTCVTDVRKTYPLALEALHRVAWDAVGPSATVKPRSPGSIAREPAFLDPTTMAALVLWGRPPEKRRDDGD